MSWDTYTNKPVMSDRFKITDLGGNFIGYKTFQQYRKSGEWPTLDKAIIGLEFDGENIPEVQALCDYYGLTLSYGFSNLDADVFVLGWEQAKQRSAELDALQ